MLLLWLTGRSQSESAIKAFAKVVRHERAAACPFDRLDVAKIIAPLDAFFATHGPAPCEAGSRLLACLPADHHGLAPD